MLQPMPWRRGAQRRYSSQAAAESERTEACARTFLVFAGEKHDVHVEARHADKPLEQRDEKAAVRERGAVAAFTQRAQGSMQHLDEDGDGQRVFEHAAQLRRL